MIMRRLKFFVVHGKLVSSDLYTKPINRTRESLEKLFFTEKKNRDQNLGVKLQR